MANLMLVSFQRRECVSPTHFKEFWTRSIEINPQLLVSWNLYRLINVPQDLRDVYKKNTRIDVTVGYATELVIVG